MKHESNHVHRESNHAEYRRAIELFRVQLWILVILHKLLLICAQLALLKHQG